MYMRVTHYKMKPESVDAGMELLQQMKDQILAMPGLVRFTNAINEDGSGCVIALVESKETSDANAATVAGVWEHFADHLAAPPEPHGFEVIADWST